MGPLKAGKTTWREVKLKKKKWKEEKITKKLLSEVKKKKIQSEEVKNMQSANNKQLKTCSIVVPSSILDNAQSPELRAYLANQVARTACIYKINEIIVLDDVKQFSTVGIDEVKTDKKSCVQFARLLQYMECPQYLRKYFFPIHRDLKYAGLMNPLDAPHHLRQDEDSPFREGITTEKPVKGEHGTYVNVGLHRECLIDKTLQHGLRVTVKISPSKPESKKISGIVVSPELPLKEMNIYWGYSVRIAHTLTEVFSHCPYPGGYDLSLGTSDKGENIDNLEEGKLQDYKHCLIAFGGLHGLEAALDNDDAEIDNVSLLFDYYINTCPNQGSRTIRTEEALLITLAELRRKLLLNH